MFYIWIIDIQFIGKLHFSLKIFMELFALFTQNCLSLSKKKNFWSSKFTHNTAFLQIFKKRCCWRIHTWPFCQLCVQYKSLIHSRVKYNIISNTCTNYTVITKYYFYNQVLKGGIWFTIEGIHNKGHITLLQALLVYTENMKLIFKKLENFHISLIL